MTTNKQRRPMTVSTVNIDVDDMEPPHREEYRRSYDFDETSSDEDKKRARLCLIALIIIIIIIALLAIAGLIIAIYSLVLSINNTQTATVTPSSTMATGTVAYVPCSSSPLTYYQSSTSIPLQCSNYTTNTDATRNIGYTASINACDNVSPFNNATSVWIRFQGAAGTLIPNSAIPPQHCGTVAAGWYAGQYPTPIFSTATSVVCFYYSTNICTACSLISVTNCGTFYVYLLPEVPFCDYRYCTL